jgi:hypothetical protein
MKSWFPKLLNVLGITRGQKKPATRVPQNRRRPCVELLEDRCVPSTMSSITANFLTLPDCG